MVTPRTAFTGVGCLDTLVTMQRPSYSVGADGTRSVSWTLYGERWAQVVPLGSDEADIAGVLTLTARYLLRVLADDGIKATFRAVLPSGEVIQFTGIRAWGPCTECEGVAVPAVANAE